MWAKAPFKLHVDKRAWQGSKTLYSDSGPTHYQCSVMQWISPVVVRGKENILIAQTSLHFIGQEGQGKEREEGVQTQINVPLP